MSTVPEEEQRQIFGAMGSIFAKASAAMSAALGRASKGDAPSRRWLAAIGHRMRGGARFMGDWWMNEDDELLGSLTAESADELASQLMSATPDEIAAEADVPSGWVEQRLRCDIPKLSLTLRSPRQRTATAGMHLGLASPRVSIPPRADASRFFLLHRHREQLELSLIHI